MLESGLDIAAYRVVKPLAENQVYQTYLVDHPEHGECRLLLIEYDQLPGLKERHDFLERAKILRGKTLPGICSLLDAQASEELSYCVFPEPVGVPLAELLEEGFPPEEALSLVKQIATALSLMHGSGLWHGNLSAETIYLDQGRVALADFALASLIKIDFNSAIDPHYASPELVCGEEIGPPADLYSLGILLYRLLTGVVPFDDRDPFATVMLHMQAEAEPLPEALGQFQPLIDGLLKPLPDERSTAQELIIEIERLLATAGSTVATEQTDKAPDLSRASQDEPAPEIPSQPAPQEEKLSAFERLRADSDMESRAVKRLQERAAALQNSGTMSSDASRASSQRMAAISRQNLENKQPMKKKPPQTASNFKRFSWLAVLGVAAGVIVYGVVLDQQPQSPAQAEVGIPVELQSALQRGIVQLQTGQPENAEKTFLGLLEEYSQYPQPYNNLASVYAAQGDLEQARSYLEKALATDESYATIYQNLGTVYSEMARDSYGRALQLEKGKQAVRLQLFPGNHEVTLASSEPQQPAAAEKNDRPVAQPEASVMLAQTKPHTTPVKVEPPAAVAPPKRTEPRPSPEAEIAENTAPPAAPAELVPQDQPKPEPEASAAVEEVTLATGEGVLQRWAGAWSGQAVDDYLAFYAADFTPANGASRGSWEQQRRRRLTKPKKISVDLSDFNLIEKSSEQITLEVTQVYQSDSYADKTRKMFDLVKQGGDWQILRERSLGRVR